MQKYYVYHDNCDSYIDAEEVSMTPGGELGFILKDKLISCFARGEWSYFRQMEVEEVKNV